MCELKGPIQSIAGATDRSVETLASRTVRVCTQTRLDGGRRGGSFRSTATPPPRRIETRPSPKPRLTYALSPGNQPAARGIRRQTTPVYRQCGCFAVGRL